MDEFTSTPELKFEAQVVKELVSGNNQWTRRDDLKNATPDQLWANFREKLNQNNSRVLKGHTLSDNEFDQVKRQIENIDSPYEAAKLLEGENGIGEVEITPDNHKLGHSVTLEIFWKADVAGGKSSYEVVEQARRPKSSKLGRNRRFDITLLINGLPLIQLELKKSTVELNEAFDQITKYADEGMYNGIFSLLQMFVIMTPDSSAYFANSTPGNFNPSFVFDWRDKHNHKVENGLDFTKQVLNIPMAHEMVSEYSVIDESRKQLILLRPYQIYAIQSVMNRIHEHRNGFIWHATGSGKTLTAYKTAKLAVQNPAVDRVVFVVDRKALDEQTNNNFEAYAANDDMEIKDAHNTHDLIHQMNHDDGKLLITSIQKLYKAVEYQQVKVKRGIHTRFSQLFKKRIVFFVDEIQRSQFGQMQQKIRKAFYNSNWYGYTGTPIFKQNAKKIGDSKFTTESLFGKVCNPIYNIRTALDDHAVLPFNVEHVSTISNLRNHAKDTEMAKRQNQGKEITPQMENKITNNITDMSSAELERKYLSTRDYEKKQHINRVVDYIMKFGPQKTSLGKGDYNAILATSSIPIAIRYYQAFKAIKHNETLMNKYKKFHQKRDDYWSPDWPHIAITFSLPADTDSNNQRHEEMVKILKDYNQQYCKGHETFTLDNLDAYNTDVSKRTARREEPYSSLPKSRQINLCIVVDRLLTGFDAPRLNTLFIDKVFGEPQQLIQAYSRTNRLQNRDLKREGQIVTFREPAVTEQNEKNAFLLYGGDKEAYSAIMRPSYQEASAKFQTAVSHLKQIAPTADDVDKLKGNHDKVNFVKAFRDVIRKLNSLSMYYHFTWKNSQRNFGIRENELQHYVGKYNLIKEQVQEDQQNGDQTGELDDLDFSLQIGSTVLVDYDYITKLIAKNADRFQQFIVHNGVGKLQEHMSQYIENQAEISKRIQEYADAGYRAKAKLLTNELNYIHNDLNQRIDAAKRGQEIQFVSAELLMAQYRQHQYNQKLNKFAQDWGLRKTDLDRVAREHHGRKAWNHEGLLLNHIQPNNLIYKMKARPAWRHFIQHKLDLYL